MKKLIIAILFVSFVFVILPSKAEVGPEPTLKMNYLINGLTVEVSGIASSTCGDIRTNWCKLEHPGKGNGAFEIKWGDGLVTCSDSPSSHTYDQASSYPITVRVKDTCGYLGVDSKDAVVGASSVATSTVATTTTDIATSTTSSITTIETKCAKEGEMTSGPVSPEFQFGCCAGLESFRTNNLIGGGSLCYDPAKGKPTCGATGTKSEGWYYSSNILLRWDNCEQSDKPVMCTKEYMPVCGELQVQCIKAPCPSIKQTYGNKCELGVAKAKMLYDGVCKVDIKPIVVDKKAVERAQTQAIKDFKKIYGRNANLKNAKDAWAVKIMTNGIGKVVRNIVAENNAIKKFIKAYKRMPKSSSDWNIVKAVAYSGVKK